MAHELSVRSDVMATPTEFSRATSFPDRQVRCRDVPPGPRTGCQRKRGERIPPMRFPPWLAQLPRAISPADPSASIHRVVDRDESGDHVEVQLVEFVVQLQIIQL